MSFMESLASASPWPKTRKTLSNLIWRKGSEMPEMSYSGAYGLLATSFSTFTKPSVHVYNHRWTETKQKRKCKCLVELKWTFKSYLSHNSNMHLSSKLMHRIYQLMFHIMEGKVRHINVEMGSLITAIS